MKSFILSLILLVICGEIYGQETKPVLDIIAKGVLADGTEEEVVTLEVHEYLKTSFFPLLNFVFFEEGSAEIPARYRIFKDDIHRKLFNPRSQFLKWEILDVYWSVLNVTGWRLKNNPGKSITLTGCNANSGVEKNNKELSRKRAEAVKKYLVDYWKINPERIKTASPRNLPEKPSISTDNTAQADAENRRVEITGDWEILKPLVVSDTTRVTNPPVLYFYSYAQPKKGITQSSINIKQKGKDLRDPRWFNGPPKDVFRWRIKEEQIPEAHFPMLYYLFAKSDAGAESPTKKINVVEYTLEYKEKMKMEQKEFTRYSLIQFDFGSDELKKGHKNILDSIMKYEDVYTSTKFYLSGYTDKIGNEGSNLELSNKRAESVYEKLTELGINQDQIIKAKGFGESISPYYSSAISKLIVNQGKYIDPDIDKVVNEDIKIDYNIYPEGRFLCRTVIIEIENSIKY